MSSPLYNREELRRLSKLGGRRRVANPNDPLQDDMIPNVENTADPLEQNLPIPSETGGIDPESYDVRANKVLNPETEQAPVENPEEEGFMSKLGKFLGVTPPEKSRFPGIQQEAPIAKSAPTQEQPIPQEQLPPEESPVDKGTMAKIGQYLGITPPQASMFPNILKQREEQAAQEGLQEKAPVPLQETPKTQDQLNEELMAASEFPDTAIKQAGGKIGESVQMGASEEAYSNPSVQQAVNEMFKFQVTPEIQAQISAYQNAMNDLSSNIDEYSSRLSEHEREIRDRIKGRDLTTQDKVLMGLALLAPAFLAGAIGGKEALMGGLAGGAKGLSEVLGKREEQGIKDQARLTELAQAKSEMGMKSTEAQLKASENMAKAIAAIPNKALHDRFSRDGFMRGKNLLLNTGNEYLPVRADAMKTEKALEIFETKDKPKLQEGIRAIQEQQRISQSLHDIAQWQRNKDASKGKVFQLLDPVTKVMKAYVPISGDEIEDPETGNKIKVKRMLGFLQNESIDAYQTFKTNVRAFGQTKEHAKGYSTNPYETEAIKEGTATPDVIDEEAYKLDEKYHSMLTKAIYQAGGDPYKLDEEYENLPYNQKVRGRKKKIDVGQQIASKAESSDHNFQFVKKGAK